MSDFSVSVIIPAYNCAKTIFLTIEAIQGQTVTPREIIIVDDGSTDNTPQTVQRFKGVNYVRQENAGPASARNKGAALATGDILFFTDSDCIPHQDWIAKGIAGFKAHDAAVVAGSYDIANNESLLARGVHREILYRHHRLMPEFPRAFGSYNFAIKRNVFRQAGGFNERYKKASGEDNDLSYRVTQAGQKIFFERSMQVRHFHQDDLGKYLREQFRHGFWRVEMYRDHPRMMAGDDYTFWKDIVEIPLVAFLGAFSLLYLKVIFFVTFFLLVSVELIYGIVFLGNIRDGIVFGFVMTLRAFARTFGFVAGLMAKLFAPRLKKVK